MSEETWLLYRGVLSSTFLPHSCAELLFTRSAYKLRWLHFSISFFNSFVLQGSFLPALTSSRAFLSPDIDTGCFLPWVTKPNGQSPNMSWIQGV